MAPAELPGPPPRLSLRDKKMSSSMSRVQAHAPVDRLAYFVSKISFETLPDDVVEKTKVHVADTIGAALAGACSAEAAIARRTAGTPGGALIWGTGGRTSARDAALVNGVAAHALELDDSGGCDHSGAVVIPAVLAAISEVPGPVSGRELIASVVAGYEVGRRVLEAAGGYDSHNGLGWHSTGTCGVLAAAAAVARISGFGSLATRDAITLATSFSSGLWAFIHDGSQAKKVHAGRAAEGGLLAARLAGEGLAGPSRVFEDVWGGFFRAFNKDACEPQNLCEGLGESWKVKRAVLKPYASCRGAHSAVDALDDLLSESGRDAAAIDRIELRLSAMLMGMCGARESGAMAAAQMSLPYALAARCVFGTAGLAAYAAGRRADPRVRAVMDGMLLEVDDTMQPLDEPVVTLLFKDGTRVSKKVPRATGSAERPMQPAAIHAKFDALAAMSVEPEQADRLWRMLAEIENLNDCRALEALLAGDGDRRPVFC
ncbi:MmgE/PrpD family protein [Sinorhizobium medicae]|nr:MmgE/PrpD family protein [Sinorhizobium medicae]MDX0419892.1 MmgE/PrpD family protein [Sinorhizobium medicae]MDX0425601.1 MmgE/PrpD family protein [Sinorhizobium medicae]MDX0468215.1 MmgE/PrpD family protein [Sinorhizobium medicae]MDX1034384.1 MmgE/PrpD family protein [Sinorhizobium medicae]